MAHADAVDLVGARARVVPPVHLPEQGAVHDGEEHTDEEEEEQHRPAEPRERDKGCQESACLVLVAPSELRPHCGGDGGSHEPEDEEAKEPQHLSEEAGQDAVFKRPTWEEDMQREQRP